eukprot:350440-Chlamydomonas_euryale.AAC.8
MGGRGGEPTCRSRGRTREALPLPWRAPRTCAPMRAPWQRGPPTMRPAARSTRVLGNGRGDLVSCSRRGRGERRCGDSGAAAAAPCPSAAPALHVWRQNAPWGGCARRRGPFAARAFGLTCFFAARSWGEGEDGGRAISAASAWLATQASKKANKQARAIAQASKLAGSSLPTARDCHANWLNVPCARWDDLMTPRGAPLARPRRSREQRRRRRRCCSCPAATPWRLCAFARFSSARLGARGCRCCFRACRKRNYAACLNACLSVFCFVDGYARAGCTVRGCLAAPVSEADNSHRRRGRQSGWHLPPTPARRGARPRKPMIKRSKRSVQTVRSATLSRARKPARSSGLPSRAGTRGTGDTQLRACPGTRLFAPALVA